MRPSPSLQITIDGRLDMKEDGSLSCQLLTGGPDDTISPEHWSDPLSVECNTTITWIQYTKNIDLVLSGSDLGYFVAR